MKLTKEMLTKMIKEEILAEAKKIPAPPRDASIIKKEIRQLLKTSNEIERKIQELELELERSTASASGLKSIMAVKVKEGDTLVFKNGAQYVVTGVHKEYTAPYANPPDRRRKPEYYEVEFRLHNLATGQIMNKRYEGDDLVRLA